MTEQWKAIPGLDGFYEASDLGRIRSVDRVMPLRSGGSRRLRGRILSQVDDGHGYPAVHVSVCGVGKLATVHSLVTAFRGPRPADLVCRHLNGDGRDPRLENLAWGTQSENSRDRVAHGTDHNVMKTHCAHGHEYAGYNLRINANGRRDCRACVRDRVRRYQLRKQKAVAS